jgi:hypothetical protein
MEKHTVLGIVDEGTCECCGARCPKRRVALKTPDGDVVMFGVVCAGKHLGMKGSPKSLQNKMERLELDRLVQEAEAAFKREKNHLVGVLLHQQPGWTEDRTRQILSTVPSFNVFMERWGSIFTDRQADTLRQQWDFVTQTRARLSDALTDRQNGRKVSRKARL